MIKPKPTLLSCHLLLKDVIFDSGLEVVYLIVLVELSVGHNEVTRYLIYLYHQWKWLKCSKLRVFSKYLTLKGFAFFIYIQNQPSSQSYFTIPFICVTATACFLICCTGSQLRNGINEFDVINYCLKGQHFNFFHECFISPTLHIPLNHQRLFGPLLHQVMDDIKYALIQMTEYQNNGRNHDPCNASDFTYNGHENSHLSCLSLQEYA